MASRGHRHALEKPVDATDDGRSAVQDSAPIWFVTRAGEDGNAAYLSEVDNGVLNFERR